MNSSRVRPTVSLSLRSAIWLLWGYLLCLPFGALAGPPTLNVGDAPPDVFGKSSTGDIVHLSDYRGRIVVISFWASWCGPCRNELPILLNMQKKATRDKLVVLSVNWRESQREFRQVEKVFKDTGSDVTLISDERGRVGDAYGVKAIPYMIIVGRDGAIAAIHVGYSEKEIPVLANEINSAWSKTTVEAASAH